MTVNRSRIAAIVLVLTLAPAAAQANTGAPLMASFIAYPLIWLVLALIVIAEMLMARRIIDVGRGRALAISATANLVSSVLGVPLTLFVFILNALPIHLIFLGVIFLIPSFFLSVFVERWVAYLFVGPDKREAVRRWSWSANIRTYEGMLLLLLVVAVLNRFP